MSSFSQNLFANPFLSSPKSEPDFGKGDGEAAAADPMGRDAEYAVLRSGPSVSDAEVERADAEVIEVQVRWGRTVLGVAHVALDGSMILGEGSAIVVPEETLGAASLAIVERGELVVPAGAKLTVERDGVAVSPEAIRATGGSLERVAITGSTKVRVVLGNDAATAISIQASRARAGKKSPRAAIVKRGLLGLCATTLIANVAFVLAAAHLPPASLDDENAPLDRDTSAQLMQLNKATMMKELAEKEEAERQANPGEKMGGAEGSAHKGPSGLAGIPNGPANGGHFAIAGQPPSETLERRLAQTQSMIDNGSYGAIGSLNAVFKQLGPTDANSAFAVGDDPTGAIGNFNSPFPGDAYGMGGNGTFGLGDGGNGWGDGLGIGFKNIGFGTGGTRIGGCTKEPCGGIRGQHRPTGTKLIEPGITPSGSGIPKDVIRRYVRGNYPGMKTCYEAGLRRDPQLRGTVSVHFVIDQNGGVETAYDEGSTMPDRAVTSCVVGVFKGISFPAPTATDGGPAGKVSVTYPIELSQDQ
jgi:hypothetical protein